MIGVGVGVENCVETANVFADCLFPKVRGCVDQDRAATVFNQNGGPGAPVARIGGMTHGAIAANGRHAHGRTAAQHRKRCLHCCDFPAGTGCGPLAIALVTSTYAMRSSYNACWRKFCSAEVRFPFVFSDSKERESIVWRAPIRSNCGGAPCSCINPSCNIPDMYSDARNRSNVISMSVAETPPSSACRSISADDSR